MAIFTVLMRSQHWPCDGTPVRLVWQPTAENEATDQQTTVTVPVFVLTEWLPPKGKNRDTVLARRKKTVMACSGAEVKAGNVRISSQQNNIIMINIRKYLYSPGLLYKGCVVLSTLPFKALQKHREKRRTTNSPMRRPSCTSKMKVSWLG